MSVINKKEMERETAEFFCTWLNKTSGTNYKTEEDVEDREADYILRNDEGKLVKLQITTSEHSVIGSWVYTRKNHGIVDSVDMNLVDSIINAIKDKCKYPTEVQKELILLIYSFNGRFDPDYLKKEIEKLCPKNDFKAIHFVELPVKDPEKFSAYDGNVIQLV